MSRIAASAASEKSAAEKRLIGIGHVDQVMANLGLLILRGFGSADVQPAIDLHRVGIDDLGIQSMCQPQGQIALAGSGRTADDQES